jgi:hypothetical protein
MGYWIIRIEFDRPAQPRDRFFVAAQGEFGDPKQMRDCRVG